MVVVKALKEYKIPFPAAKKINVRPVTLPSDGEDQVLWKMFGAMYA